MEKKREKQTKVLSHDQLSVLFYQLSLVERAGIGAEEGLLLLLSDANEVVRGAFSVMREQLVAGQPMSKAMQQSGLFPPHALQMVEIGELTGRQEQVFTALSTYYEREQMMQQNLYQSLLYPGVMSLLAVSVFLVLISRVMPVFSSVFQQLGVQLSPTAALLMRLGAAAQHMVGAAVVAALLAVGIFAVLYRRGAVNQNSLLRGETGRYVARSRFSAAMALMMSSGLPLDDALERVQHMLEDTPLAPQIKVCTALLAKGVSFSRAIEESCIFPVLETGLLVAGFHAGLSDQAMEELAQRSQEQAEERLARFLSRFQYSLVLILCFAVALVILSVMLPLLGVLTNIGM